MEQQNNPLDININDLKHRVVVEEILKGSDGQYYWSEKVKIWCSISIDQISSMEKMRSGHNVVFYKIIAKFHPNIKSNDRIIWQDKIINIKQVYSIDANNEYLEIMAEMVE